MALLQFFPTFMPRFIRKLVPKGLIWLGFEDSKPKSWLIFQKCHYNGDIWPRLELNRCQKMFSASVKNWTRPKVIFCLGWNWTVAKNCFLPRLKIEPRPKGSLGFKNRESLFFFFFLACAFSLSATHLHCYCCAPTTRDYLTFGSFLLWLSEVRFGARKVGIILLCCKCVDGDWSLMVARRVGGGSVKKLAVVTKVVLRFGGGDTS